MGPKRLKVGEDIEGTTKGKTGFKGRIVEQILTENHPKWKISWENGTETIESSRGIKKRPRTYEDVQANITEDEAEEARLIQIAVDSPDEGIGEESDDSDSSDSNSVDIFGYI